MRHFINDVVSSYVAAETAEGFADDWDLDRLWTALKTLYPVSVTPEEVVEAAGGSLTADTLLEQITSDAQHAYDAREEQLGAEVMREVERRVVLSVLDRKWREHLYEMDYLQEGIGLRAMAQRDPLVEYQREGFQLFEAMNESIKEESVGYLFNIQVDVEHTEATAPAVEPVTVTQMLAGSGLSSSDGADGDGDGARHQHRAGDGAGAAGSGGGDDDLAEDVAPVAVPAGSRRGPSGGVGESAEGGQPHPAFRAKGLEQPVRRPQQLQYSAPTETGEVEQRNVGSAQDTLTDEQLRGVSRNGPCPCGSGKKFKMCHGKASGTV